MSKGKMKDKELKGQVIISGILVAVVFLSWVIFAGCGTLEITYREDAQQYCTQKLGYTAYACTERPRFDYCHITLPPNPRASLVAHETRHCIDGDYHAVPEVELSATERIELLMGRR